MSDSAHHSQHAENQPIRLTHSLSAPRLPSSNSTSGFVYASSKKRAEFSKSASSSNPLAGQQVKLTPLDLPIASKLASQTLLEVYSDADKDLMILSLHKRVAKLEAELHQARRYHRTMEKRNDQLESWRVFVENTSNEREMLLQELRQTAKMRQIEVTKLSNRYVAANEKILMLASTCAPSNDDNAHRTMEQQMTLIKTLTKENQDFHRKLRNFEQRYREDKLTITKQEGLIQNLHSKLESFQLEPRGNDQATPPKEKEEEIEPSSVHAKLHSSLSYKRILQAGQNIDPRMLSILEKSDPHDSTSSAVQLATLMKKWLQSCMDLPCSLHLPTNMQRLLQRTCGLLHCQYAAYFDVESDRAIGLYSNEHGEVCWPLEIDKGFVGYAAKYCKTVNVPKALEDLRYHAACDTLSGTKSKEVLCVPIMSENSSKSSDSVVGVLRIWNSVQRKPFTSVEQIVASFLAIEAGIAYNQSRSKAQYMRNNALALRLLRFPAELAKKCGRNSEKRSRSMDVQMMMHSERFCAEILGSCTVRIFLMDPQNAGRLWYVNAKHSNGESGSIGQKMSINATSTLCEVVVERQRQEVCIVEDPLRGGCYNDGVDLEPGANGIMLAPILSLWHPMLLLGIIQITRDRPVHLVQTQEEAEVSPRDEFTIEILELFSSALAGVIHQL
uniref:Uncharacterized protein AlNc14C353G10923 n=1 Tax=Albugo laibachii Nc14 TaxID=890382 RepID=F0WXH2_9STRA|nr:conserved hypothetical protein [Albugo laibachii Nc14]|eukprot:CCA26165.1 conserved hypothetical protein [Albugo laibachii Nc14]